MLYEAADKYFASQQDQSAGHLQAADHYLSADSGQSIFKQFLRISLHKPRDLLTLIKIAKDLSVKSLGRGKENRFSPDVIRDPVFTKHFADYMLGEVRNYAAFYMAQEDFDKYMKFFQYLNGQSEFKYEEFQRAFVQFKKWINGERLKAVEYVRDPEALLQFFYDVNVIGYREEVGDKFSSFFHFAFRERTLMNIAPKVKTTGTLMVNRGLAKSLDIGLHAHVAPHVSGSSGNGPGRRKRPIQVSQGRKSNERPEANSAEGKSVLGPTTPKPARKRRRNRRPKKIDV
jgi:hypothetical protein